MVELRPMDTKFVLETWEWFQDPEWLSHDLSIRPHSAQAVFEMYQRMSSRGEFIWCVWKEDKPIGVIIFESVNYTHETAYLTARFGERKSIDITTSCCLAMDWAFKHLRLYKIYRKTVEHWNLDLKHFEKEGVLKEACRDPETGKRMDFFILGITKEKFYNMPLTKRVLRNRESSLSLAKG